MRRSEEERERVRQEQLDADRTEANLREQTELANQHRLLTAVQRQVDSDIHYFTDPPLYSTVNVHRHYGIRK